MGSTAMSVSPRVHGTIKGKVLAEIAESWAQLPASDDGYELMVKALRLAYGRGYTTALETERE